MLGPGSDSYCSYSLAKHFNNFKRSSHSRLPRFNIYAPLVKTLKTDIDRYRLGKPTLEVLLEVVPYRPPLPKLRELILTDRCNIPEKIPGFLAAFIPRPLTLLRVSKDSARWMKPHTASELLKSVADTAPGLQMLQLFVVVSPRLRTDFADIARFLNLCALECSSAMLDPGTFQLLGTLPRLESLVIEDLRVNDPEEPENEKWLDLELSAHSFPVLRHLNMRRLPSLAISQLFRAHPLVHSLISISITLPSGLILNSSILSNFMRDICKASPCIVELSLNSEEESDEISLSAIDCLQQLPLDRLRFLGITPDDFEPMVFAIANIRYLDIHTTCLIFDDLILVAKHLTQLRYLSSDLNLYRWPDLGPLSITPSPSTLCLRSGFFFGLFIGKDHQTIEDYLSIMARKLHTLWPKGICCVAGDDDSLEKKPGYEHLKLLNDKIKDLRQSEGLQPPAYDTSARVWLYN